MAERVEVSFNPHGAIEAWPHLIATVGDPAGVERLFELGEDGWRCTMVAGGPGGYELGGEPADPATVDALWAGATALTETPDAEAVVKAADSDDWSPWNG